MDYLYDGSFDGFLTCVHSHYYEEKAEGIFEQSLYPGDLVKRNLYLSTDEIKSDKVSLAIAEKISGYDLKRIYRAFRTCEPNKEMNILRYIELGFRIGPSISKRHGDPVVFEIQRAEQKLGAEVHRLCGLIRFSVMRAEREVLYSQIEPDNDVLEFIAPHFTERFHSDPFIIHDLKRLKALVSYKRKWYITDYQDGNWFERAEREDEFRSLWKNYFDTMAIKERTNPKCQRNFMPVRYWKHLIEVEPPDQFEFKST